MSSNDAVNVDIRAAINRNRFVIKNGRMILPESQELVSSQDAAPDAPVTGGTGDGGEGITEPRGAMQAGHRSNDMNSRIRLASGR